MHFALTSEQALARSALRELLQEHGSAAHLRRVFDSPIPTRIPGLWSKLNELGVISALAPEAIGGLGLDAIYLSVLLEETGRAAVPDLIVETAAVAVPLLAALPDNPRAAQALQRILAGASVAVSLADATTPPTTRDSASSHCAARGSASDPRAARDSASDPRAAKDSAGSTSSARDSAEDPAAALRYDDGAGPRARRDRVSADDASDSRALIVGAELADMILCERSGELHLLERDPQQQDFEAKHLTPVESVDRARRLSRFTFDASAATCLARGEQAQQLLAAAYDHAALGTAAQLVGLGQHMLELTIAHAKTRRQFGQAIGAFQAVKHQLVDAHLGLEFAAPLVYRAAHSVARNDPERSLHVSMAKAFASEAALVAARKALQLHGAIGYSYEYELQLYMKRAWALAAAYGDARAHRGRIADVILKGELHA